MKNSLNSKLITSSVISIAMTVSGFMAIGNNANASGCTSNSNDESHGIFNVACGDNNTAGGIKGTLGNSNNNVALGSANYARGGGSTAVGYSNSAEAVSSTAMGNLNYAWGGR